MTTAPEDNDKSSPSLVTMAMQLRKQFKPDSYGKVVDKVIVKAEEMARVYHNNNEAISATELDVLYEVLREFGILASHVPQDFHVHVANVIKCLEAKDKNTTRSHVAGLIFSRM